jgi:hypothetical protein
MTVSVLAKRAGMDETTTRAALAELAAEDDESRSRAEKGRRIVLIDQNRAWGWHLVNWEAKEELRKRAHEAFKKQGQRARDEHAEIPLFPSLKQDGDTSGHQGTSGDIAGHQGTPSLILSSPSLPTVLSSGRGEAINLRFLEFWRAYPRKVERKRAWKIFSRLSVREQEAAVSAANEMAAVWNHAPQDRHHLIKHPSTWLNAGCWNDDREEWKRMAAPDGKAEKPDPTRRAVENIKARRAAEAKAAQEKLIP